MVTARLLAVAGTALLTAAVAAPASAAPKNACARDAKVVKGSVVKLAVGGRAEDGTLLLDETEIKRPKRGSGFYVAREATELNFGGARYSLAKDTIFGMLCTGYASQSKLTDQSLDVESGSATVHARGGHADGISGIEGAGYNWQKRSMRITVSRTPKGDPSFDEIFQAGPSMLNFGTTKFSISGNGVAAITPYIGRGPSRTNGQCHYGKGAELTSTGFTPDGYRKGSVRWTGLTSYSPR